MSEQALPVCMTTQAHLSPTQCPLGGLMVEGELKTEDVRQKVCLPHVTGLKEEHNLCVGDTTQQLQHFIYQPVTSLSKYQPDKAASESGVCDDCDMVYHEHMHGTCSIHGPFSELDPSVGFDQASLTYTPLPVPAELTLRSSLMPGAVLGVFATMFISKGVRMGPYEGRRIACEDVAEHHNIAYAWEVRHKEVKWYLIDGEDTTHSNWMRYVKCARHIEEQNMAAYQCSGNIYYQALRSIGPDSELLVWYGEHYAKNLGVAMLSEAVTSKFFCRGCGESFVEKKSFHIHIKHSSSCNYATLSLSYKTQDQFHQLEEDLQQQISNQEHIEKNKTGTIHCPYCRKGHCHPYQDHGTHSSNETFSCEHCGNSFSHSETLHQQHLQLCAGDKPYSCEQCGSSFGHSSALNQHLKMHSSDKLHECEHCGRSFSRSSNLQRHLRIHSGDRPFTCDRCEKNFRSRSNLQQHLATHSDVKPYKCDQCGKSFGRTNNLQRHLRIHSGNRPYKCKQCGKCFIQSSHLHKHFRTHSSEQT